MQFTSMQFKSKLGSSCPYQAVDVSLHIYDTRTKEFYVRNQKFYIMN